MKMELFRIPRDFPGYPGPLKTYLGSECPVSLTCLGNGACLREPLLGLFVSRRCPGTVLDQTYRHMQTLRRNGRAVVAGFQSPLEKECLRILLASPHPVVICLARGLGPASRVPPEWRDALDQGRLCICSPFETSVHRANARTAAYRNRVVGALATSILIPHIDPEGQLKTSVREFQRWGKPMETLDQPPATPGPGAPG